MTQQTFSVDKKPRVVIARGHGTITIGSWQEQSISVETAGVVEQLYQEGETVYISGYETDLTVTIPYMKPWRPFSTLTNISISDHDGAVIAENVGNIELNNISGNVELSKVEGNLQANNVLSVQERKGIGGNAALMSVSRIEIGAVGANLVVQNAETVRAGAVGASLDAGAIGATLDCSSIGANCSIHECPHASVQLSNVGGNLQIDRTGVAAMSSSNVGGNLTLFTTFAPGSNTRFMAGGNATITLPENVDLRVHAMAGGSVMGEALGNRKRSNMLNVVYGNGAATLNVTAGGNVRLQGNVVPNEGSGGMDFSSFGDFGREWGNFGRDLGREMGRMGRDLGKAFQPSVPPVPPMPPRPPMPGQPATPGSSGPSTSSPEQSANTGSVTKAQKREAILRMVAEGRITPDEGNMLLDALEKE